MTATNRGFRPGSDEPLLREEYRGVTPLVRKGGTPPVRSGATTTAIKGWCPGALNPMRSGDGLIVRLRVAGGILEVGLAEQIARWSLQWGNGQIDLTNRANLQLRGVHERYLPDLWSALTKCGLLDASSAGEAVRNVVSSPLSGLDPAALLDVRPIARALEQRLAGDAALHGLPGKFSFSIDDGGSLALNDRSSDIRFEARGGTDDPEFDVVLSGALRDRVFRCRPDELVDTAVALALEFLRAKAGRNDDVRRMRDLVAARGVDAIGQAANISRIAWRSPAARPKRDGGAPSIVIVGLDPSIADADRGSRAGSLPDRNAWPPGSPHDADTEDAPSPAASPQTRAVFAGVGLPFGRIAAADLILLASAAVAAGAGEFRLTPWRMVLVPVTSTRQARAVLAGLPTSSFILDATDSRCRIAACVGTPACARGMAPVRDHAFCLEASIQGVPGSGIVLHVSGCEKSCAHPGAAPLTLVARGGRYDLVRDGAASNNPIARSLTLDEAAEQVRRTLAGRRGGAA